MRLTRFKIVTAFLGVGLIGTANMVVYRALAAQAQETEKQDQPRPPEKTTKTPGPKKPHDTSQTKKAETSRRLSKAEKASDEEKPPLLPNSFPPYPVIASMDKRGRIVLRMREPEYKLTKGDQKKGKSQVAYETIWREHTYRLRTKEVRVYDSSGKEIDAKTLPALLKNETWALYSYGQKVDPQYLRTTKDGTLIFVYLDPEPPPAPGLGKPPERSPPPWPGDTPVHGLGDFLKKQGYVAVPLERLESGHLAVRVQVEGKKLVLLLDTGAWQTALDRYRVRDLDLDWDDDFECDLEDMEIGKVKTGPLQVGAHDMTDMNRSCKYYDIYPLLDGLLGADVLLRLSAVIDHAGAILYLRKPEPKK